MFGNIAGIREETRDMWSFSSLDTLMQDVRYGYRVMMKSRGFSAVAILSLAAGIGASSVLFSVANAFLFRELPGARTSELMRVFTSNARGPLYGSCSYADYEDLRDRTSVFNELLAYNRAKATLSDSGQSVMIPGVLVSANYFEVLGLGPRWAVSFYPKKTGRPGPTDRGAERCRVAAAIRIRSEYRRTRDHPERSGICRRRCRTSALCRHQLR